MFERYTETARQAIVAAKSNASQVGSADIQPEHLLSGLLAKDRPLALRFVASPQTLDAIRAQIEPRMPDRNTIPAPTDLPLSRACKYVIVVAAEEVDKLSSKHIGTEHLLLGLLGRVSRLLQRY